MHLFLVAYPSCSSDSRSKSARNLTRTSTCAGYRPGAFEEGTDTEKPCHFPGQIKMLPN